MGFLPAALKKSSLGNFELKYIYYIREYVYIEFSKTVFFHRKAQ